MLRVVFLTLYPFETASTRQRIYKNVRLFSGDVQAIILPGIDSSMARGRKDDAGRVARAIFLLRELGRKLVHLWRARDCDLIVLQKGLTVMNVRGLPRILFALGRPVVFDFDDAVHLGAPQALRSRLLRPLLDDRQIERMLPRFDHVIAGNAHLAAVARSRGAVADVIVTPMDSDWYRARPSPGRDGYVVGWSGSTATNHYVARLGPILRRVAARVPGLELRIISNDERGIDRRHFEGVTVTFVPWRLESLVDDLLAIDVGVMPLDDDEWSRSKCGGKILQYMACAIPPVASPVGINRTIIDDGTNGFLAADDDAWVARLTLLLTSPELRMSMGAAARRTVEGGYSNRVTAPQLERLLRSVAARPGQSERSLPRRGNSSPDSRDPSGRRCSSRVRDAWPASWLGRAPWRPR